MFISFTPIQSDFGPTAAGEEECGARGGDPFVRGRVQ